MIGPTRPINIRIIIITRPADDKSGVRFIETPTVAMADDTSNKSLKGFTVFSTISKRRKQVIIRLKKKIIMVKVCLIIRLSMVRWWNVTSV